MSRYESVILEDADIRTCYDVTKKYFLSIGYQLITATFPSTLIYQKKSSYAISSDLSKGAHEITIAFSVVLENQTQIKFNVKFEGIVFGSFKNDKSFETIFESLKDEINYHKENIDGLGSQTKGIVHHEKIIERQIVKVRCRYCGTLNNDGVSTCESCGARL